MPNLNNKTVIGVVLLSLSAGVGVTLLSNAPEIIAQRKPENRRFDIKYDLLIDRKTAELFTWMDTGNGERRLAKLDKTSESTIRNDINKEGILKQKNSQLEYDNGQLRATIQNQKRLLPKTERIFQRTNTYKDFIFNSRIKYRDKEKLMLYRVAVTLDPTPSTADNNLTIDKRLALSKNKCLTRPQQDSLKSLYNKESGNVIVMRFTDSDNFWLQDSLIKLGSSNNTQKGSLVDAIKPEFCLGQMNQLVFHGRLKGVTLPDYQHVSDGKLVFSKVLFKKAEFDDLKARELFEKEYQLLEKEDSLENKAKLLELEDRLKTKEKELDKYEDYLSIPKTQN